MPNLNQRPLSTQGMGDLSLMSDSPLGFWLDCDRAFVGEGDELRSWYGYNRRGMKLWNTALHGAAREKIQIMRDSQATIRKTTGHLLAAVDRSAATGGRVLALAHHAGGRNGTQLVNRPIQTTGSGLSDLSTRGIYSGAAVAAVFVLQITAADTPDVFKWSADGGLNYTTGVAITGDWQTLISGVQIKFTATTGHTVNNVWKLCVGGRPGVGAEMNRVTPHDYPRMVGQGGKIIITHGYEEVLVSDGKEIKPAGPRAPHIKPVATAATFASNKIGKTDEAMIAWLPKLAGTVVTRETANPAPADGSSYVKMVPPSQASGDADIAYANITYSFTATASRVKFWLYSNAKNPSDPRRFALVFGSAAGLTGDVQELIVPDRIPPRRWVYLDLAWTAGAFVAASVGLRVKGATNLPFLLIDGIDAVDDGAPPDTVVGGTPPGTSVLFAGSGKWRFAATWYDRTRDQESAPSPLSDQIQLDGKPVRLDISGSFAGMDDGLANVAPTGVDAVHLYAGKEEFGPDARFGLQQLFRISPPEGFNLEDFQFESTGVIAADGGNTGNGAITGFAALGSLATQVITLTATSAGATAAFALTTTGDPMIPATATTGTQYISAGGALRFLINDGSADFIIGDKFTLTITRAARTDGKLSIDMSDPIPAAIITAQPLPPFQNRPLEPGDLAIVDGNLVVTARQRPYSVGEWEWTEGSHVITPVADDVENTPVPARWMEGRQIQRAQDTAIYTVVKALDQDGDGVLDALWIARQFDPDKQEFTGAYEGETGEGKGPLRGNTRSLRWSNVTSAGPDPEFSSPLNDLELFPEGEEILVLFKSGEWVWALGTSQSFILRQNVGALADDPVGSGTAYSDPVSIEGLGGMAGRAVVALAQGAAMFLSNRGELIVVSGSSFQRHPVSSRLAAILSGYGFLADTRALQHSFMDHVMNGREEFVYLGITTGGQTDRQGEPGVALAATDHWRDEEDSGETEPVLTETFPDDWSGV